MKFSCYKEDLTDALKAVMPAAAVKPYEDGGQKRGIKRGTLVT